MLNYNKTIALLFWVMEIIKSIYKMRKAVVLLLLTFTLFTSYSRINIEPEYDLKRVKALHLNLKAGITVRNKLEPFDSDGNIELNLSSKEKYFFSIGLTILM
jgi:hypothetical protein